MLNEDSSLAVPTRTAFGCADLQPGAAAYGRGSTKRGYGERCPPLDGGRGAPGPAPLAWRSIALIAPMPLRTYLNTRAADVSYTRLDGGVAARAGRADRGRDRRVRGWPTIPAKARRQHKGLVRCRRRLGRRSPVAVRSRLGSGQRSARAPAEEWSRPEWISEDDLRRTLTEVCDWAATVSVPSSGE